MHISTPRRPHIGTSAHLRDVAQAVFVGSTHVEDEVWPLVLRQVVRLVLHDSGAVVIGVDVVAKVLDALLLVLSMHTDGGPGGSTNMNKLLMAIDYARRQNKNRDMPLRPGN